MNRTQISAVYLVRDGSAAEVVKNSIDADNGMYMMAGIDGKACLRVYNDSEITLVVTIKARSDVAGDNLVVSVAKHSTSVIGPLESARFEQADECIYVDFSHDSPAADAFAYYLP